MGLSTAQIVTIIVSFLSGSFINALANYFINKRKTSNNQMQSIINIWEKDNERLRQIEQDNRKRILALEKEIIILRSQILVLESAHQTLPFPMWLKNNKGIMLAVNEKYVDIFLEPRGYTSSDYIGSDDFEVWPRETANKFRQHDTEVLNKKNAIYFNEMIPDEHGQMNKWIIVKYPRKDKDKIIGIAGIALPNDIKKLIENDRHKNT